MNLKRTLRKNERLESNETNPTQSNKTATCNMSMQRTIEYENRIQELEQKLETAEDAISQLKDKLQEHEKI